MSEEKTSKEEWEEIARGIEVKIRRDLASWAGADETDDWATIGRKAEDRIRGEIATELGGEPEEDWGQIGERADRHVKHELCDWAGAEKPVQIDSWTSLSSAWSDGN